jgi:hypothetical protein
MRYLYRPSSNQILFNVIITTLIYYSTNSINMLDTVSNIVDIRNFNDIPTDDQYHIYRNAFQSVGQSFHKTQLHIQKLQEKKTQNVASDSDIAKLSQLNTRLDQYGKMNYLLQRCFMVESELVEILQPIRLYCMTHFTPYYVLDAKRFIKLQNKYKEYLALRSYIRSTSSIRDSNY